MLRAFVARSSRPMPTNDEPTAMARAMSLVVLSARVALLSWRSVFLSSNTRPESVIRPTMAWLSWKALSVAWIRYAVAPAQRIDTIDVTPIAMRRLSSTLALGCADLGLAFGTDILENVVADLRPSIRERAHGCEL